MQRRILISLTIFVVYSCGALNQSTADETKTGLFKSMESEKKLKQFFLDRKGNSPNTITTQADSLETSSKENSEITNNQENGVDEGGLVKNIGDYLITLKNGVLYAANIKNRQQIVQSDKIFVAPNEQLKQNVWYDELLVHENRVFVIAYRYRLGSIANSNYFKGGTEINSFLLVDGKFQRSGIHFIESNDYFSTKNYASRMIDGNLVFYTLYSPDLETDRPSILPMLHTMNQNNSALRSSKLLDASEVKLIQEDSDDLYFPTMHLVTKCKVEGNFECKSLSFISEPNKEFYVSNNNIFLAVKSFLHKISIRDFQLTSHKISGYPIDQFSFKEKDNKLFLVTRDAGLHLNKLKFEDFNALGDQKNISRIRITDTFRYGKNRFIGDYLVSTDTSNIHILSLNEEEVQTTSTTEEFYYRIEPLGKNRALLIGNRISSRHNPPQMYILDLESSSIVEDTTLEFLMGEYRSHGFSYKESMDSGGIMSIALNSHLSRHSDNLSTSFLGFYKLGNDSQITEIGIAKPQLSGKTRCSSSCYNWYGNTRPIFLGERTFALMGLELQELDLKDERFHIIGEPILLQ